MGKRVIRSGQLPVIVDNGLGTTVKALADVKPGTRVEAFDVTIRNIKYIRGGALLELGVGDKTGLARVSPAVLVRDTQYIAQGAGVTVRGEISQTSETPLIELRVVFPATESAAAS
ncbi:hypothetical protein ACFU0X_35310 [Streptomyces cellulosae]|uniref:Uncharacterized protein n=1 Tax=Streptomyces cellulosae TaxID=1968 RepID=A0ABW6JS63_STRCE